MSESSQQGSNIILGEIIETPKKNKKTSNRRKAMTEEEIRTLQQMRDAILKKTRSSLGIQEISDKVKQLVVPDMGTIKGETFETPLISDTTWKRNEHIWVLHMNQAMVYCLVHQAVLQEEERELILKAVFLYSIWKTPAVHEEVNTELDKIITTSLPKPTYNIVKGMPWIAIEWPIIEQYLLIGGIKEQIINETETQLHDILEEDSKEDFDKVLEKEIIKATLQSIENKIKELQEKNKKLEKELNKKGVHFDKSKSKDKAKDKGKGKANLLQDKSKSQNTKEGNPDNNDNSSSSNSSVGGANRSESNRSVREVTSSQQEWKKLTGQKEVPKITKRQKNANKIVKLPTLEIFDGENPK